MKQVFIIKNTDSLKLQQDVNDFLRSSKHNVLDVKYAMGYSDVYATCNILYSAMILFEVL